MKRDEVVDMVFVFLGCDEDEVASYFENTKGSHLKYAYMQQVYIENWDAAETTLKQGKSPQVIRRFRE
ncbi:hypothetical protein A2U01_0050733, partial [Trifolium medium]|nr:hypothetical protein [Trifolium medium]